MPSPLVIHLDTSVLLPLVDKKKLVSEEDEVRSLSGFRYRLLRGNQKIKVSIIALGEFLNKAINEKCVDLIWELQDFISQMNGRFSVYMPKFRDIGAYFTEVLQEVLECDDYLKDNPADAMILVTALLDEEASYLYTFDHVLVTSTRIHDYVKNRREEYGFKRLRIRPPPTSSR